MTIRVVPPAEPVAIDGREAMLEAVDQLRASIEAGEVTGLAYAAGWAGGGCRTGWTTGRAANVVELVGGVSHLLFRMHREALGTVEVDDEDDE